MQQSGKSTWISLHPQLRQNMATEQRQVPPDVDAIPEVDASLRIRQMYQELLSAPAEVMPSKYWIVLNKQNLNQLKTLGFANFKQTLALNYFTWLVGEGDEQIKFLCSKLDPAKVTELVVRARTIKPHQILAGQSGAYNLLTLLLWEYAKQHDPHGLLNMLEEPRIGNPPEIIEQNRIISEDLANSFLEYHTITQSIDPSQLHTIWEVGAGYGRTAFVFLKLLPQIRYVIVDIPPALYVAERYLSTVFPKKRAFLFRPFSNYEEVKTEFEQAEIAFLLPQQTLLLPDKMADLFINISSLHEMRPDQIEYYFGLIDRLTRQHLYIKQWKTSQVHYEGIKVCEADYPFRKHWKRIFQRECAVQTYFFEALYAVGSDHD
jgi:putative sugar O-methyltransferase